jgi:hypothetical protein
MNIQVGESANGLVQRQRSLIFSGLPVNSEPILFIAFHTHMSVWRFGQKITIGILIMKMTGATTCLGTLLLSSPGTLAQSNDQLKSGRDAAVERVVGGLNVTRSDGKFEAARGRVWSKVRGWV